MIICILCVSFSNTNALILSVPPPSYDSPPYCASTNSTVCSWKVFSVLSPAGKPSLKIAPSHTHTQAFLYRSIFPVVLFPWLESHFFPALSSFFPCPGTSDPLQFCSFPPVFPSEYVSAWHEVSLSTWSPNKILSDSQELPGILRCHLNSAI